MIDILAHSAEAKVDIIRAVMNIAAVVASYGDIPDQDDIDTAPTMGRWWYRDGDTFELYQLANDAKAFVRGETEDTIRVEFYKRYDGDWGRNIEHLLTTTFGNVKPVL